MKKQTYWQYECPSCGHKIIGNKKELLDNAYMEHFLTDHFVDPYVKSERR